MGTLDGSDNAAPVTAVQGKHPNGAPTENVLTLDVFDNKILNQIPPNIGAFFPNLLSFRWSNGNLTSVIAADLQPFPNLILLILISNKIVSLDGNLFQYTPSVRFFSVDSNLLKNVGFGLLNDLQIYRFYFYNNTCINIAAFDSEEKAELIRELRQKCPPLRNECTDTTKVISPTEPACRVRSDCEINSEVDGLVSRAVENEAMVVMLQQEVVDLRRGFASLRKIIMKEILEEDEEIIMKKIDELVGEIE